MATTGEELADRHQRRPELLENTSTEVRVLLCGNRELILDALQRLLGDEGLVVARAGSTPSEAVAAAVQHAPNVVLTELPGSGEADLALVRELVATGIPLVGFSFEADLVDEALWIDAGVVGVAGPTTSYESLGEYVRRAARGETVLPPDRRYELEDVLRSYRRDYQRRHAPFAELTTRERAIFAAVYEGLSADQIAEEACVSVSTVRTHIRSILAKLNVHSQLAAVALARTSGWFDPVASSADWA